MKNTRKLIPALAMLLVSAVMMSTASFAWFTMNSTVTADGITVTAVAPASLWIAQSDTEDWDTTMTFGNENTPQNSQFIPSRVEDAGTVTYGATTFQKLSDASLTLVKPDGTIQNATYVESDSFFKDTFQLKLDSQLGDTADIDAKVTISYSGNRTGENVTPDAIYKALRVAIVAQGSAAKLFEFTSLDTEVEQTGLVTLAANQSQNVEIYVWLEGSDTDCKNANALNCDDFSIEVEFSFGEVDKPSNGEGGQA